MRLIYSLLSLFLLLTSISSPSFSMYRDDDDDDYRSSRTKHHIPSAFLEILHPSLQKRVQKCDDPSGLLNKIKFLATTIGYAVVDDLGPNIDKYNVRKRVETCTKCIVDGELTSSKLQAKEALSWAGVMNEYVKGILDTYDSEGYFGYNK